MNLAKRIQTVLDENPDVDQVELARLAHVTKGAINQLLNGSIKSLKLEYAVGIQDSLGYSAVWLVLGKGPKKLAESAENVTFDSSIRGRFDALSDEAKLLIECIERIDGRSDMARKAFRMHTGLLLLSARPSSVQHSSASTELIAEGEQEAEEIIARNITPEGENVTKRKRHS